MAVGSQTVMPGLTLLLGVMIGLILSRSFLAKSLEGFQNESKCGSCGKPTKCPCPEPDLSAYVLKSSVPPCPSMPDLSKYMLKTECPPVPDLSKYVLKSSIPKPQPVVLDCSKCQKPKGECPPCPRPRCPEVKCPAPTVCPPPAPCPRQTCPPTVVKCKAEDAPVQQVRPYLTPLDVQTFGM